MAEVLSQSQIDALLSSAFQSGLPGAGSEADEQKKKYRKYDFYSPKKFTKDKLKLLSTIYESYARLISSRLNGLLRINSEVNVVTVEEQRYYEFSNALNDNDVITVVDANIDGADEVSPIYMYTSTQLMLNMIDRTLGSNGDGMVTGGESGTGYAYTDLELALYENIMRYIVGMMKDGWSNYLEINFEFSKVERNPGLMQTISMDETIVIVVMDVSFRYAKGQINICIPGVLLSSIFAVFDKRAADNTKGSGKDPRTTEEIMMSIKDSTLEITAQLGSSQVLLSDIYNLHVGDVINLNKPKDSEIYLYIENKPWFKGKLGMQNKNMAVKINGVYENQ